MEITDRLINFVYSRSAVFNSIYYYYVLFVLCMIFGQTFEYCDVGVKFKQLNQEEINSFTSFEVSSPIEVTPMEIQTMILTHKCVSFCARHENCTIIVLNGTRCYFMAHHTCGKPNINIYSYVERWERQEIKGKEI